MASSFLSVPRKKVSSHQEIIAPLTKYITDQEFNIIDFQEALNEIDKLRTDIRVVTDENLNENILPLFYRYYGLLSSLEKRVPIAEQEGQCKITFYWYCFNVKTGKVCIHYEIACLLYNIAAVLSFLAAKQNFETDTGIKVATAYFRQAAATFEQVKEYLTPYPTSSTRDMGEDFLNLYSSLMLAQAQELYCLMASKTQMPLDRIAQLYIQASDYYGQVKEFMASGDLKQILGQDWVTYIDIKKAFMKGIAHYQYGKFLKAKKQYGYELGRYKVAYQYVSSASTEYKPLQAWMNETKEKIKTMKDLAEKDNNNIYHERVVLEHQMDVIQPKSMVSESARIPKEKLTLTVDPLAKLVPFHVRKGEGMWKDRREDLMKSITTQVEDMNKQVKGVLQSVGLPGALESIETPEGIPQTLLQKMNAVKSFGGLAALTRQLGSLSSMATECDSILDEALKLVEEEEKDDNDMRAQYGSKWVRTESRVLSQSFYEEKAKHQGNLLRAVQSDGYIQSLVEANQVGLQLLGGDEKAMIEALPSVPPGTSIPIEALKKKLQELDELLFNREQAVNKLKATLDSRDITSELMRAQIYDFDKFFVEELKRYEPNQDAIKATFGPQPSLLSQIQEEVKKIHSQQSQNPKLQEREKAMNQVENVFKTFLQIKEHLSEGIGFYTSFQTILRTFRSKCSDHVFARKTEKQDLLREIQARAQPMIITNTQNKAPTASMLWGRQPQQAPTPAPVASTPPYSGAQQVFIQPTPVSQPVYTQAPVQYQPQYVQPGIVPQGVPQYGQAPPPSYQQIRGTPPPYQGLPTQQQTPQIKPSAFPSDPYGLNQQQRRF